MNILDFRRSSNIEDDRGIPLDPLQTLAPQLTPLDYLLSAQLAQPGNVSPLAQSVDDYAKRMQQQSAYPPGTWPRLSGAMDAFSRAVNQVAPLPAGTPLWLFLMGNHQPVQFGPGEFGGGL